MRKHFTLKAPDVLQVPDVTEVVDHGQHKDNRVAVRHVCRTRRRFSKKGAQPEAEPSTPAEASSSKPVTPAEATSSKRLKRKTSMPEEANEASNTEEVRPCEVQSKKPRCAAFAPEDIDLTHEDAPLFNGNPGQSVLRVVSNIMPHYKLTGLASDTRIVFKEERRKGKGVSCKFYQILKGTKAVVGQISVNESFDGIRAKRAAQVMAILSLNGMEKSRSTMPSVPTSWVFRQRKGIIRQIR